MNKIELARKLHQWTIEVLDRHNKVEELLTPREWNDLDSLNKTVLISVAKKIIEEFKPYMTPKNTTLRYRPR